MKINVLKFGGSSVANNENLNVVANKIIKFKKEGKALVVIVSAQGKTTDKLLEEAKKLSTNPNKRELDALINVGEQITASKLAILLNDLGYDSISLNGWQAGIKTSMDYQNANIVSINTARIINELNQGKIVIITGFQGVDNKNNITTLGRGGSDTSAVAIASVLNAEHCYIFSDVDGVYTADPNKVKNAKKLKTISYKEMKLASNEGAKVLHDRCVELAEKYNTQLIAKSTFNSGYGTTINSEIEENKLKNIVKNDNILIIHIFLEEKDDAYLLLNKIINQKIKIGYYKISNKKITLSILNKDKEELTKITKLMKLKIEIFKTSKISFIGNGISNNFTLIDEIVKSLKDLCEYVLFLDISSYKISIQFNKIIDDDYLLNIHSKLFNHN